MLKFYNQQLVFKDTPYHYKLTHEIDSSLYPSYHNFYEIIFVAKGIMRLELCGRKFLLTQGSLAFVRPYDIHTKSGSDCSHINLAFPSSMVESVYEYLDDSKNREHMLSLPYIPPCYLSVEDATRIGYAIKSFEYTSNAQARTKEALTMLRAFLLDTIAYYITPIFITAGSPAAAAITPAKKPPKATAFSSVHGNSMPRWLIESISAWREPDNRHLGLEFFCERTGFSKEYLCRSFKKYVGNSPSVYLNSQRLSYAIHLLAHSDLQMVDIAYEAGFNSVSRFYHLFKQVHGVSPKRFLAKKMASE